MVHDDKTKEKTMSKKNAKQVKKNTKTVEKIEVQVLDADVEPSRKHARVTVRETEPVAEEKPVEPVVEEKPVEKKPLTAEEKRAKRNEYARKYYKAHREKLAEASRLCHARKRAAMKAAKLEAANENK